MRKRILRLPIISLVISMLFVAFDWFKFDLSQRTNYLAVGMLTWCTYFLYGCFIIWTFIYFFQNIKKSHCKTVIPLCIALVTVFVIFFIPFTNLYSRMDFAINLRHREEIIKGVDRNELAKYQIGESKYLVPYRLTSQTGVMYVLEKETVTKIMFYVYQGISKSKVLIYVSDDSGIQPNDFNVGIPSAGINFTNVLKVTTNWYSANIVK